MQEEIIKGYNQEKLILVDRLSQLDGSNKNISTISAIRSRLQEIDKKIEQTYNHEN